MSGDDDSNVITLDPATPRKGTGKRSNGGRPTHKGKVRRDAMTLPGVPLSTIQGAAAPRAWSPVELIKACREETERNIAVLRELRDDAAIMPAVRACAVSMLFDRAYGRAPQMIHVADVTPKSAIDTANLSDEELLLLDRLLSKASGTLPPPIDITPDETDTD